MGSVGDEAGEVINRKSLLLKTEVREVSALREGKKRKVGNCNLQQGVDQYSLSFFLSLSLFVTASGDSESGSPFTSPSRL